MSPIKEPHYFTAKDGVKPSYGGPTGPVLNRNIVYRWENYVALFDGVGDELAIGETSPWYLFTPGTARRIRERLPDVQLVAILRNPADRTYSQYLQRRRDGTEPSPTLEEAIADEPRRARERWGPGYFSNRSLYAGQLEPYFSLFPRSQIRIMLYDDFVQNPRGELQALFEFLGVAGDFTPDMSERHNPSGIVRNPFTRALWTRTHGIRHLVRPVLSRSLRTRVTRFVTSRAKYMPPMSEDTRRMLVRMYESDIRRLEPTIGRDLSHWLE